MIPKINRIVAIENYGVSGSTLLHSLLDDHPNIISLPLLHGQQLYLLWNHIKNKENISIEDVKKIVLDKMPVFFNLNQGGDKSLGQLGENQDESIEVNYEQFMNNLAECLDGEKINSKNFIISVYMAYNMCWNKKFNDDDIICFPIHSMGREHAKYLANDFKEVYFIHTIREPVQNIGSIMKHVCYNSNIQTFRSPAERSIRPIITFCEGGKFPFMEDVNNKDKIIKSVYVRLEDLHNNPTEPLGKICKLLNIEWNDVLLKTTFTGKLWHNRQEMIRVSGLGKQIIQQKHVTYLNKFDRFRLRLLSKTEIEYFKYGKLSKLENFLNPLLPLFLLFPFKVDFNRKRLKERITTLKTSRIRVKHKLSLLKKDSVLTFHDWKQFEVEKLPKEKVLTALLSPIIIINFFVIIVKNYLFLRMFTIKTWYKRLNENDSHTYVKAL